jgi:hypothetical protein
MGSTLPAMLFLAAMAQAAHGEILDRVAVTVGKDVITESEVVEEIRATDFLNQAPLDYGPAARRAAADRLVDQYLIRGEIRMEGFPQPQASAADQTLRQFRQAHFHTLAQYQASLQKYGITDEELKQHLLWQVAALRFTQQRFGQGDRELDAWLKQTRSQNKIAFHQEAFE